MHAHTFVGFAARPYVASAISLLKIALFCYNSAMSKQVEPLLFQPNVHTALWGRESWEVSVHPAGPSVIANGPDAGRGLPSVLPDFPLLVKIIDAKTRLSVQVHPNETTCRVTGGDPKTEMWCLLDDGFIYAGLKEGVGPKDIEGAVASGRFEELMVRHDARAGDVFFIPGGLVHAIGDNTRIYEVQQSSDTTFRLYDWNRVGADGKPRQLHIEQSLRAIDYGLKAPDAVTSVECPFFRFRTLELNGATVLPNDGGFVVLFAAKGCVSVNGLPVEEGRSVLVPGGSEIALEGSGAKVFVTKAGLASPLPNAISKPEK